MSRSVFVPLHFYSCRKQSCLCLSDLFQHFSSLVLTAYSLASAPTKLKTCSCTSWHAFSHASPPPLISPPPLPSISLSLSFLSRLKAYSHQTWLGSRKRQRLNFKGRLQVCYTHTHTHFLLISNNQAPVLKTGYFSALSYCQNPPNQTSFMQGRQQYKSRQPQSTRMHIHCHFRPWDVALWLLPAKSRFKVMTLRVKWQTNPFRSVSPKEG